MQLRSLSRDAIANFVAKPRSFSARLANAAALGYGDVLGAMTRARLTQAALRRPRSTDRAFALR